MVRPTQETQLSGNTKDSLSEKRGNRQCDHSFNGLRGLHMGQVACTWGKLMTGVAAIADFVSAHQTLRWESNVVLVHTGSGHLKE